MKKILNFETKIVNSEDRLLTSTSSKGNQIKWRVGNTWLKADTLGYEGLVESIASDILAMSNIQYFTRYKCVKIIEKDTGTEYIGCMSDEFLAKNETLITLYRLFELHGINLDLELEGKSTIERLKFVISKVEEFTGILNFGKWLCLLLEFDAFILNEDRHFHNIAVIFNNYTGNYRLMPVFDCGAGLLSDITIDYKLSVPIMRAIKNVHAKPFSAKFSKQLKAVEALYGLQLNFTDERYYDSDLYGEGILVRINQILKLMYKNKNQKQCTFYAYINEKRKNKT